MPQHFCSRCKTLVPPNLSVCPRCGHVRSAEPSGRKSKGKHAEERVIDPDAPGMFPYDPRPFQLDIVKEIKEALISNKNLVMESGTGTGKTVCGLVGALEYAKDNGKKIIYLTRTISQSDQVVKELRSISKKRKATGLPLLGRGKSCLLIRSMDDKDLPPHALSKLCEERKQRTIEKEKGGCPHYADFIAIGDTKFSQFALSNLPTAEEFDRFCERQGACPYEARKSVLPLVDVIIVPYVQILSEDIRRQLLDRLELTPDCVVVVVDEAHNLVDAARDNESFEFSVRELDFVEKEMQEFGSPKLAKGVDLSKLIAALHEIVEESIDQMTSGVEEVKLGRRFLEGGLRSKLKLDEEALQDIVANLVNVGEMVIDQRLAKGREPMSAILRLGLFLDDWFKAHDARFLKLISLADEERLVARCLEPQNVTGFLKSCNGVVHMSGTLQPLRQYVDILDLPQDSILKVFPSPFPPENKLVLYTEDANPGLREMRGDPTMQARIENHITDLCNATSCNTMVFFRSYEMMRSMRESIEEKVERPLYWEGQGSMRSLSSAIERFKQGRDGVFCTVMGGKVAEGLDFPGQELDMAIIVGLPYPPPSVELSELKLLYERKYGRGKGWEYTSAVPALRKVQQAIGRLIRAEKDRGVAVIIDSRAGKYREQLGASPTSDPVRDVTEFLARGPITRF